MKKLSLFRATTCALATFTLLSAVNATEIRVEVSRTRGSGQLDAATDQAARAFTKRFAELNDGRLESMRRNRKLQAKISMPTTVVLTDRGKDLPFQGRGGGDIQPVFDASGVRSFDSSYRDYLVRVFTAAKPLMNAVFGSPAVGGAVRVRNYDADIQDRYAVGGGYYIPNGANGPEIRFPVYNNRVTAGINYIHTLLLAYLANKGYAWDAYNEGLVRAATMIICRTPGALPDNPDADQIESTLLSTYDVGEFYDWYNVPGLGGPKFVPANLLDTSLPVGGSTGGIFLLRYQMAGTAFAKLAVRYPGFISELNSRNYINPNLYKTTNAIETLMQQALDTVSGVSNTKIEGFVAKDWAARQGILDTRLTPGLKVITTPIPVLAQAGTSDFGVFDIVMNCFRTKANGDELLLSGTSYPLFWRPDFSRFFAASQDDVIQFAGAYGSVTPNFVSDTFSGKPYRVVVDVPFQGKNARSVLPAGTFSTGSSAEPTTFFGTVLGVPNPTAGAYKINLQWVGGKKLNIPVTNFAFGSLITDPNYLKAGPITVILTQSNVELFRREFVKSTGGFSFNLTPLTSETSYTLKRPSRLEMRSIPIDPFRPNPADILGQTDGETLFGRWNSNIGKYDLYPDEGEWRGGLGYWIRPATSTNLTVKGRSVPRTPVAVSLSPGWNQVAVPFDATLTTTNVLVTVAAESVSTFDQAIADGTLGTTFFKYVPDASNPDAGTMAEATTFEPGKAYFVKVNRAEGAVLLFIPIGGPNSPDSWSPGRSIYRMNWEAKVVLTGSNNVRSAVRIGQADGATNAIDSGLDLAMPPHNGGMQLSVLSSTKMYRDIRDNTRNQMRDLLLAGLTPGQTYTLEFSLLKGNSRFLIVDRGRQTSLLSGQKYTFVASQKAMKISAGAQR